MIVPSAAPSELGNRMWAPPAAQIGSGQPATITPRPQGQHLLTTLGKQEESLLECVDSEIASGIEFGHQARSWRVPG